jgi:hypothetical protein
VFLTRYIAVGVLVAALGAGGSVAAGASGQPPKLRSNLRAAALPTVALSDDVVLGAQALLGTAAERYGVTAASFAEARYLGQNVDRIAGDDSRIGASIESCWSNERREPESGSRLSCRPTAAKDETARGPAR